MLINRGTVELPGKVGRLIRCVPAFGKVWLARNLNLGGRLEAVKILKYAGDPQRLAALRHEASILGNLDHANIVRVYAWHEKGGEQFLAMQYIPGTSLAEIEKLISELESLRDILHAEGQRVQREISGYAQLSQAAMKSTRMIADNVQQWKRAADGLRNS